MRLVTSYGDVRFALPSESSFRLESRARGGKIFCDFIEPDWKEDTREDVTELRGSAGEGASPVVIETSHGDIRIVEVIVEAKER